MIAEAIRRSIIGIAYGGIVNFIAITIVKFTGAEPTISEIWLYMLLALILGVYFGLSSLIFTENGMSMLKQTVIHYFLSLVFYFFIAFIGEWTPIEFPAILLAALLFTLIYAVFWMANYLYYKKIEEKMNENLKHEWREEPDSE